MAKIITAYVSELLQQHLQGVISFSRMVELLNEKANEPESVQQISEKEKTYVYKCIHCGKEINPSFDPCCSLDCWSKEFD